MQSWVITRWKRVPATLKKRQFGSELVRNAHSTGLKIGLEAGRGWRIVAGPTDLHPINLQVLPKRSPPARTHKDPAIFKPATPPTNIIGGYRSPGAPSLADVFGREPEDDQGAGS